MHKEENDQLMSLLISAATAAKALKDSKLKSAVVNPSSRQSGSPPASLDFAARMTRQSGSSPASLDSATGMTKQSGSPPALLDSATRMTRQSGSPPASLDSDTRMRLDAIMKHAAVPEDVIRKYTHASSERTDAEMHITLGKVEDSVEVVEQR
ncbi:uncharacterized protein LOC126787406 [Argentina anserina]|uniref:uncharacterized protein LOC126787406 n=1 Tax=Argentina anserina TaxID=57926 RepID=UPI0021764724|nr:uncharacterized protein LOC126787406 [Potentilla anserina]